MGMTTSGFLHTNPRAWPPPSCWCSPSLPGGSGAFRPLQATAHAQPRPWSSVLGLVWFGWLCPSSPPPSFSSRNVHTPDSGEPRASPLPATTLPLTPSGTSNTYTFPTCHIHRVSPPSESHSCAPPQGTCAHSHALLENTQPSSGGRRLIGRTEGGDGTMEKG